MKTIFIILASIFVLSSCSNTHLIKARPLVKVEKLEKGIENKHNRIVKVGIRIDF